MFEEKSRESSNQELAIYQRMAMTQGNHGKAIRLLVKEENASSQVTSTLPPGTQLYQDGSLSEGQHVLSITADTGTELSFNALNQHFNFSEHSSLDEKKVASTDLINKHAVKNSAQVIGEGQAIYAPGSTLVINNNYNTYSTAPCDEFASIDHCDALLKNFSSSGRDILPHYKSSKIITNEVQPEDKKGKIPEINYCREELEEIIEALDIPFEINTKLLAYIDTIGEKVTSIRQYQTKKNPANFYPTMHVELNEIRNIANTFYDETRKYHPSLPNTLKELIFSWLAPFEKTLTWLEMPLLEKKELMFKTKRLYAEQSYVSRKSAGKASNSIYFRFLQHLEDLKKLLAPCIGQLAPRCYISYAWPSKENQEEEYWVQPFLSTLYDHLTAVGIRMLMDIRDNKPGENIYSFMEQYHHGNYVILVGTESLRQNHYGHKAHAIQTELNIILNRFEQDQQQFGQSRIYPMLISGTIKTAYPEHYQLYVTRDARDQGYLDTLKQLMDWLYETPIVEVQSTYTRLWQIFSENFPALSQDAIETEIANYEYHQEHLNYLRQYNQYRYKESIQLVRSSNRCPSFQNSDESLQERQIYERLVQSKKNKKHELENSAAIKIEEIYLKVNCIEKTYSTALTKEILSIAALKRLVPNCVTSCFGHIHFNQNLVGLASDEEKRIQKVHAFLIFGILKGLLTNEQRNTINIMNITQNNDIEKELNKTIIEQLHNPVDIKRSHCHRQNLTIFLSKQLHQIGFFSKTNYIEKLFNFSQNVITLFARKRFYYSAKPAEEITDSINNNDRIINIISEGVVEHTSSEEYELETLYQCSIS